MNIYTSEKEMLKAQRQPKREWVGLSFGEARKLIDSFDGDAKNLVYDTEAKLQEKNT